jgi:hypothetical protein
LPFHGCIGVEGKVLVRGPDFFFSILRFAPDGTIHEHPRARTTRTSPASKVRAGRASATSARPLRAGEFTVWPKGVPHRLWTEGTTMMTLMYERVEAWRTTVTVRS